MKQQEDEGLKNSDGLKEGRRGRKEESMDKKKIGEDVEEESGREKGAAGRR